MANWKHTLDIKDFYKADIPPEKKAKKIADKLGIAFPMYLSSSSTDFDEDLEIIRDEFSWFGEQSNGDIEEFDYLMDNLYDWADQEVPPFGEWPKNKMCWIATF